MTAKERFSAAKAKYLNLFGTLPPMMQMAFQGLSLQEQAEIIEKANERGVQVGEVPGDLPEVPEGVIL